ncbi:hypothetical protein GCM10028792_03020 [Salinisphaera aquimarina]
MPIGGRRQRGAILIMTAAFIVAAVSLLALAVDAGRLYAAQQKLQSAANLAALDSARQASGCRTDLGVDGEAAASASVARNYAARTPASLPTVSRFQSGQVLPDQDTKLRVFSADNAPTQKPNAVRLTVVDNSFRPLFSLFSDTDTTLSASAGAISRPEASLQFGTTLANVDPTLLSALLDTDISVASLGDLANARVTLADLVDIQSNVISVEDVSRISISEALNNVSGQLSTLSGSVVNAVRDSLGDQPLSAVLGIAGPIGGDASVALGNIVNAAAQLVAIDRDQAVPLDLSLPGVNASLRLLAPPKTEIGPAGKPQDGDYYTVVHSSQLSLALSIDLDINLGLASVAKVTLPVGIQVAQGTAQLERIDCPTLADRSYTVVVTGNTALIAAAIGSVRSDGSIDTTQAARVTVLGQPVAEISNDGNILSTIPAGDEFEAVFDDIESLDDFPRVYTGDDELRTADIASLLGDINLHVDLLRDDSSNGGLLGGLLGGLGGLLSGLTNAILGPALDGITAILQSAVTNTLGPVLDPVLAGLGVSLAVPSVTLGGLNPNQPELFCTSAGDCGFVSADE